VSNELLDLYHRVASLERRLAGMVKHGKVAEVNASEGWVRLDLGEGDAGRLKSPKIPYAQFAGALKVHTPPSEGQQMTWLAPGGDSRQSFALPLTWSEQNESPSDAGDENVLTYGNVRATIKDDLVKIEIGGLTLELTGNHMRLSVGGAVWKLSGAGYAQAGGGMGHDGQDVGSTHRHPDVEPGPAQTGTPVASGPTP
jgi:hypothetical protein